MNVIALGRDVGDADVGVGGRGGEELHDADGAGLAARALVELRFLVALGADHQPVEAVPVTVFLKQHDKVGQAVLRLGVERLLRPLCALQVLMQDDVAGPGALMRLRHEAVHRGRELRAVLAERSEEHTSELQSLMRISYAVFCLKKKKKNRQ